MLPQPSAMLLPSSIHLPPLPPAPPARQCTRTQKLLAPYFVTLCSSPIIVFVRILFRYATFRAPAFRRVYRANAAKRRDSMIVDDTALVLEVVTAARSATQSISRSMSVSARSARRSMSHSVCRSLNRFPHNSVASRRTPTRDDRRTPTRDETVASANAPSTAALQERVAVPKPLILTEPKPKDIRGLVSSIALYSF